jgi:hypothetical protein
MAQLPFDIWLFAMTFATLGDGSRSDRHGRRPVRLAGRRGPIG